MKAENKLMTEAKRALRNSRQNNKLLDSEVEPLFKDALRDYKKQRYLMAADKFRNITLKYPEYENSEYYYQKINGHMNAESRKSSDSDFERVSYARGYVNYRENNYSDSINEWEKVLQMDPKRSELDQYIAKVRAYLKDIERMRNEKEIEDRVYGLFMEGKDHYDSGKWISCIKIMEKVQAVCKNESFRASYEWSRQARELIDNSISQLSTVTDAGTSSKESSRARVPAETEIDSRGADKKYTEGLILYAQGKTSEAIRVWEIALRLDPKHEKAGKAVERTRDELETNKHR